MNVGACITSQTSLITHFPSNPKTNQQPLSPNPAEHKYSLQTTDNDISCRLQNCHCSGQHMLISCKVRPGGMQPDGLLQNRVLSRLPPRKHLCLQYITHQAISLLSRASRYGTNTQESPKAARLSQGRFFQLFDADELAPHLQWRCLGISSGLTLHVHLMSVYGLASILQASKSATCWRRMKKTPIFTFSSVR